jgi:hypothetical protein
VRLSRRVVSLTTTVPARHSTVTPLPRCRLPPMATRSRRHARPLLQSSSSSSRQYCAKLPRRRAFLYQLPARPRRPSTSQARVRASTSASAFVPSTRVTSPTIPQGVPSSAPSNAPTAAPRATPIEPSSPSRVRPRRQAIAVAAH